MGTSASSADSTGTPTEHRVELAVSKIKGLQLPGMQAYHTSVLVDGLEYSFDLTGVTSSKTLRSHENFPLENVDVLHMGFSELSGYDLIFAVTPHFRPGTYDLLQKNCNSFSDCALYFLLGARLEGFSVPDSVGATLERYTRLVYGLTLGGYQANAKAESFDINFALSVLGKVRVQAITKKQTMQDGSVTVR
eukprot:TRINITY_DN39800_c0_g1_i1.p1 TRINITY_DN39800_c0_g1~~TRINITY_DN39800_c0_g1_i1.p1  ORF type:complete len:192 (-),score=26.18 TRINITY_DN39800_c0_g1_i1:112-687(-)